MAKPAIQPAKGTRDCYPDDLLRRRYIEKVWRSTAVRHGFDEIDGPTFETSDLYAVKSGEGILGELFQAFSGKSEDEVEQVKATGRAPYALRPEFTPTLARMYAARARQLPQPCKWFSVGPYFRAERPQRGRLREFLQWNVDIIGTPDDRSQFPNAHLDAELIDASVASLETFGMTQSSVKAKINDRDFICRVLAALGVGEDRMNAALALLDRTGKMPPPAMQAEAKAIGFSLDAFLKRTSTILKLSAFGEVELKAADGSTYRGEADELLGVLRAVMAAGRRPWCEWDPSIVRGLAYYTGTVFEVIADGERAVAGGGRYDKLVELMGGPPTPAVGFAMGDVVLGLLLDDHALMPDGRELMDAVSAKDASRRPEVFVLNAGNSDDAETIEPLVRRLTADLRRGVESPAYVDRDGRKPWQPDRYDSASGGVRPRHARVSYKSTRNLKKLLADAERQHARFAAIVHGSDRVQLKDLDRRADLTPVDIPGLPDGIAECSVDPESPVYVGRAVDALLA